MQPYQRLSIATALLLTFTVLAMNAAANEGARIMPFYGYDDCIELRNKRVSVILCPAAGGRVLQYASDGGNILALPEGDEGWKLETNPESRKIPMHAGRFDIGPEKMVTRGKVLWAGAWKGEITGDRSAKLTSRFDPESGVRLVREFTLHQTTSQLRCTQTILNESKKPVNLCHWSRTFAVGKGIAVVPRSPRGRFPNGYIMYSSGTEIQIKPDDPNIRVSDDAVIVGPTPESPKLGFDSHKGWLAYLTPNNQMFVKRFATFPDRSYNEFAALTISIWYPRDDRVELEPIGPAEHLKPGQKASFTEDWWILPREFPGSVEKVDIDDVTKQVDEQTIAPDKPPKSVVSPEVHPDRSVTFRFVGDDANVGEVLAVSGKKSWTLAREIDNTWTARTEPLEPGIYSYVFRVDGVDATDPRNRDIKKWFVCKSIFEVPGDPPLITEQQDVPHGTIHHHIYNSSTTGTQRHAAVYTPPGYRIDTKRPYPVMILCHGFGDDQTAWTEVGRAHHIMDNLIAKGRIEPLVIVMPHGHPVPLAKRIWSEDYNAMNGSEMIDDIVEDLLPMITNNYHVSESPHQRAIAGLSMGGGHAIRGGMLHPDKFAWVGAFSAAAPKGSLEADHSELLAESESAANSRKLFWIACGKDDFLLKRNRQFTEQLEQLGISHEYVETDGSHSWNVWRDYLPRFLELIFQD